MRVDATDGPPFIDVSTRAGLPVKATGTARYSIGNCQGATNQPSRYPSTGLAGEVAQNLFSAAAQTDAEITQMRADMKTKWNYA